MAADPGCEIYLITPASLPDPAAFADTLARALDAAPVACVQLRLKDTDDDTVRAAADVLRPVAHARDVAFLMNDRPDLAVQTGCDGVHIGQDDTPLAEARRILGAGASIGVTCHDSRHLAMLAAEAGADYVAFGAFYPSETKDRAYAPDPEILSIWADSMTVPSVAIGGITPENCAPLVQAGADFLAVCNTVWACADGPDTAVRALKAAIDAALDAG